MSKPLSELSISEAGALMRSGSLTSVGLTEYLLNRIASLNPTLHAFVLVTGERALGDAERADRQLKAGFDLGPLYGIPYALKDIFATAGILTTCHSKLLIDHVPKVDSAVEEKLRAAGAVLLGKLATHEFALGGPSFELPFPPARNPWNVEHFTGASSSGAGAAVAAGMTPIAMGSDTSGSIRGPACLCGTVGLKPTYGLVSRRGAFPLSYSLDHCGPLTWRVRDAALVMNVVAGHDPLDPSSATVPVPDFTRDLGRDLKDLRIGVPRHFLAEADGVSTEVVAHLEAAAATLSKLGATVEEIKLPDFQLFDACGRVIMAAEAYAIHEKSLRLRPMDYGKYTYQRIIPGATLSAADLTQAFRLRRELTVTVNRKILNSCDVLICPTCLAPAARLSDFPSDWPPPRHATATLTIPFNVTGNPALAIPMGFSAAGLPLGMQIIGRPFAEPTVLRVGAAYESAMKLTDIRPNLRKLVEHVNDRRVNVEQKAREV